MTCTITVSQFDRLNAALTNAKHIAAEQVRIAKADAETRAELLELFLEIGLDNKSVPGLTTAVTTTVNINEKAAFDWAMQDENYLHAAPIVNVKAAATGSVLALFKDDAKRAGVFELNKTGYKKAVREGMFVGIPFDGIVESISVKLKEEDIQTGPALLGKFNIVTDDEAEGRKGIAEMQQVAAELAEAV